MKFKHWPSRRVHDDSATHSVIFNEPKKQRDCPSCQQEHLACKCQVWLQLTTAEHDRVRNMRASVWKGCFEEMAPDFDGEGRMRCEDCGRVSPSHYGWCQHADCEPDPRRRVAVAMTTVSKGQPQHIYGNLRERLSDSLQAELNSLDPPKKRRCVTSPHTQLAGPWGSYEKLCEEDGLHNLWSPCICHPFQTSSGCMVCDDSEYLRIEHIDKLMCERSLSR